MSVATSANCEEFSLVIYKEGDILSFALNAPTPRVPVTGVLKPADNGWRLTSHHGTLVNRRSYATKDEAYTDMGHLLAERVVGLVSEVRAV